MDSAGEESSQDSDGPGGNADARPSTPEEEQGAEEQIAEMDIGQQNPLSLPPVIANILQYLGTPMVTACRTISKDWNRACTLVLGRRKIITINSIADVTRYCQAFSTSMDGISLRATSIYFDHNIFKEAVRRMRDGRGGVAYLTTVLHDLARIAGPQLKKFKTRLVIMGNWTPSASSEIYFLLSQLVFTHFTKIQDMELNIFAKVNGNNVIPEACKEYSETTIKDLPNLKNLIINSMGCLSIREGFQIELKSLIEFSKRVLQSSINLKSFQWGMGRLLDKDEVLGQLSAISPQLEAFEFTGRLSTLHMEVLTEHRFPNLKSITACISWTEQNDRVVQRFLTHFASVITALSLDVEVSSNERIQNWAAAYNDSPPVLSRVFPPPEVSMPLLETLVLAKFKGIFLWENVPNVKELHFKDVAIHPVNLKPSTVPPDWVLKHFEYSQITNDQLSRVYLTVESPEIPIWFSSLHRLSITVPITDLKSYMPQIFRRCHQLKALAVTSFGENGTDCGDYISGMSNATMQTLKEACPDVTWRSQACEDSDMMPRHVLLKMIAFSRTVQRSIANIGHLSELQELDLSGKFSDDAVLFGVVLCTKIQKLRLKSPKLTDNAEQIAKCALQDLQDICVIQS